MYILYTDTVCATNTGLHWVKLPIVGYIIIQSCKKRGVLHPHFFMHSSPSCMGVWLFLHVCDYSAIG